MSKNDEINSKKEETSKDLEDLSEDEIIDMDENDDVVENDENDYPSEEKIKTI